MKKLGGAEFYCKASVFRKLRFAFILKEFEEIISFWDKYCPMLDKKFMNRNRT